MHEPISTHMIRAATVMERLYKPHIWCGATDAFADGDVELKNIDIKLKGQLATPTYEFRNGKILIESKADIKKRLGNK